MSKILSYGSMNVDYVYHVPHFLLPGETLSSTSRTVNCGGKGLNQSIALARAGAEVYHAGKLGSGGEMLAQALKSSGVDVSLLASSEGPTGHTIIQIDPAGQNCIMLFGGSNQEITRAEVDRTMEGFGPGDYLILQNEINELAYIMESAHKKGVSIVLNPSPINENLDTLPLELVSLLVFNEIEGAALAGTEDESAALDILRKRFPNCRLLMTLGSRGCIYDDGQQRLTQGIYKVKAVDTTAAGDTFTGYFVTCLSQGMEPAVCLDLASRASAIAVTRPGAADSIPTMDEVLNYSAT